MIHPIFIFILIISSNFLADLFPCRIQDLLKGNMMIKHIFAFLTLLFFAVLVEPYKQTDFNQMLLSTTGFYVVFLMMINSNTTSFVVSLVILGILYILNLRKIALSNKLKEKDEVESSEEIIMAERLELLSQGLIGVFILSTMAGFLVYMGEKKLEYKNKFSYIEFVFGRSSCKPNKTPPSLGESVRAVFTH